MRVLACLALLLLAALPAAGGPLTIRVGYAGPAPGGSRHVPGLAGIVAAERYIEREIAGDPDLSVEWVFFKGAGPAVNEAFANGQLDFAFQGDLPSVIGRASGLKTKIVLATGAHAPLYLAVPPGSAIGSVKDLKGRKVSIFRGTNNHLAAVKVLAANGLTERDLSVLNMDVATTNAALASGDIDAAFGNFGLISLQQQGRAKIVYSTKGDDPAFERQAGVLVAEAFETAHPDLVAKVVKALVKASHFASDEANRDAVLAIWARSGTPDSVYRYDYADQPLRTRNSPIFDPFLVEQYRVQARQARAYGLIRRDVDVAGWFEPRYLDRALKELGLETHWPRLGPDGKPLS